MAQLQSFSIDELQAFVLALRHLAHRSSRGRARGTMTVYDDLADRLLPVLRQAEATTFMPIQVAGTRPATGSTLPPEPSVPLLALSAEDLGYLWGALVEEAGELKRPPPKGSGQAEVKYRRRQAVIVKRAVTKVERIQRRARSLPAARLALP
jgi:hypothetical protein